MVSLPLPWLLLSIDLNGYVGARLSTEGTSNATFWFFHVNNIVPASVILGRIGQYILGTKSETQPAALTSLSINYYGSFWHVCTLSESMSRVCRYSRVLPDKESPTDYMISCLRWFVNVVYSFS